MSVTRSCIIVLLFTSFITIFCRAQSVSSSCHDTPLDNNYYEVPSISKYSTSCQHSSPIAIVAPEESTAPEKNEIPFTASPLDTGIASTSNTACDSPYNLNAQESIRTKNAETIPASQYTDLDSNLIYETGTGIPSDANALEKCIYTSNEESPPSILTSDFEISATKNAASNQDTTDGLEETLNAPVSSKDWAAILDSPCYNQIFSNPKVKYESLTSENDQPTTLDDIVTTNIIASNCPKVASFKTGEKNVIVQEKCSDGSSSRIIDRNCIYPVTVQSPIVYACLAGYDKEIFEILDEILKITGTEIEVFFYLFQKCKFSYITSHRINLRDLQKILSKYHHYICLNKNYVETYNENEHCWYIEKLIMIPSYKNDVNLFDKTQKTQDFNNLFKTNSPRFTRFLQSVPLTLNIKEKIDANAEPIIHDIVNQENVEEISINDLNNKYIATTQGQRTFKINENEVSSTEEGYKDRSASYYIPEIPNGGAKNSPTYSEIQNTCTKNWPQSTLIDNIPDQNSWGSDLNAVDQKLKKIDIDLNGNFLKSENLLQSTKIPKNNHGSCFSYSEPVDRTILFPLALENTYNSNAENNIDSLSKTGSNYEGQNVVVNLSGTYRNLPFNAANIPVTRSETNDYLENTNNILEVTKTDSGEIVSPSNVDAISDSYIQTPTFSLKPERGFKYPDDDVDKEGNYNSLASDVPIMFTNVIDTPSLAKTWSNNESSLKPNLFTTTVQGMKNNIYSLYKTVAFDSPLTNIEVANDETPDPQINSYNQYYTTRNESPDKILHIPFSVSSQVPNAYAHFPNQYSTETLSNEACSINNLILNNNNVPQSTEMDILNQDIPKIKTEFFYKNICPQIKTEQNVITNLLPQEENKELESSQETSNRNQLKSIFLSPLTNAENLKSTSLPTNFPTDTTFTDEINQEENKQSTDLVGSDAAPSKFQNVYLKTADMNIKLPEYTITPTKIPTSEGMGIKYDTTSIYVPENIIKVNDDLNYKNMQYSIPVQPKTSNLKAEFNDESPMNSPETELPTPQAFTYVYKTDEQNSDLHKYYTQLDAGLQYDINDTATPNYLNILSNDNTKKTDVTPKLDNIKSYTPSIINFITNSKSRTTQYDSPKYTQTSNIPTYSEDTTDIFCTAPHTIKDVSCDRNDEQDYIPEANAQIPEMVSNDISPQDSEKDTSAIITPSFPRPFENIFPYTSFKETFSPEDIEDNTKPLVGSKTCNIEEKNNEEESLPLQKDQKQGYGKSLPDTSQNLVQQIQYESQQPSNLLITDNNPTEMSQSSTNRFDKENKSPFISSLFITRVPTPKEQYDSSKIIIKKPATFKSQNENQINDQMGSQQQSPTANSIVKSYDALLKLQKEPLIDQVMQYEPIKNDATVTFNTSPLQKVVTPNYLNPTYGFKAQSVPNDIFSIAAPFKYYPPCRNINPPDNLMKGYLTQAYQTLSTPKQEREVNIITTNPCSSIPKEDEEISYNIKSHPKSKLYEQEEPIVIKPFLDTTDMNNQDHYTPLEKQRYLDNQIFPTDALKLKDYTQYDRETATNLKTQNDRTVFSPPIMQQYENDYLSTLISNTRQRNTIQTDDENRNEELNSYPNIPKFSSYQDNILKSTEMNCADKINKPLYETSSPTINTQKLETVISQPMKDVTEDDSVASQKIMTADIDDMEEYRKVVPNFINDQISYNQILPSKLESETDLQTDRVGFNTNILEPQTMESTARNRSYCQQTEINPLLGENHLKRHIENYNLLASKPWQESKHIFDKISQIQEPINLVTCLNTEHIPTPVYDMIMPKSATEYSSTNWQKNKINPQMKYQIQSNKSPKENIFKMEDKTNDNEYSRDYFSRADINEDQNTINYLKDAIQRFLQKDSKLKSNLLSCKKPTEIYLPYSFFEDNTEIDGETYIIKTDDPNINLKCFKTKAKMVVAKLIFQTEETELTNFVPVVNCNDKRDHDVILNIAKEEVKKMGKYPIIAKQALWQHFLIAKHLKKHNINGAFIWPVCQCN